MQGNSGDIGTYAYNCINQIQCKREIKHIHVTQRVLCLCCNEMKDDNNIIDPQCTAVVRISLN